MALDIHTVVPESRGIIQEIIDSNSRLARSYEKLGRLDAMWLLIAVDERMGSGGLNFSIRDSQEEYELGVFDRAFFIGEPFMRATELRTARIDNFADSEAT